MRAIVLPTIHEPLTIQDVPSPKLQSGEAKVQLSAAAWNKRDHWISKVSIQGSKHPPFLALMAVGLSWSVQIHQNG